MSAFETNAPLFEKFLKSIKDLPADGGGSQRNAHFIARNFLLEEHLDPLRVASYVAQLAGRAPRDLDEWRAMHDRPAGYLGKHVFLRPEGVHDHRYVNPTDPAVCPETFRAPLALIGSEIDLDTPLIRLVAVDYIATSAIATSGSIMSARRRTKEVFDLGKRVVADPSDVAAQSELQSIFDDSFTDADYRPVFAAFRQDVSEELQDVKDPLWANKLRNQLGLFHIRQLHPPGLPRSVFLFAYNMRDVPQVKGEADRRPLAVPAVLDQRLCEAFCPAPLGKQSGWIMNLIPGGNSDPVREVLHPRMPLQVKHLIRVGEVTEPVSEDLSRARGDHLFLLRILTERDDYGADTDSDLLL